MIRVTDVKRARDFDYCGESGLFWGVGLAAEGLVGIGFVSAKDDDDGAIGLSKRILM